MADMELAIKISEEEYMNIKKAINSLIEHGLKRDSLSQVCLAILEGTPLPKGHWIKIGDRGFGYSEVVICKCSKCGFQKGFRGKFDGHNLVIDPEHSYNYCPNCRADMREVEEGGK